jgi:AraC-like DNA-binding protein
MDDQFLSKVFQQIEDNLDNERFSVEDLAKGVALSRSMLHRKLAKLTGKAASNLITENRLIKAKDLPENNVATGSVRLKIFTAFSFRITPCFVSPGNSSEKKRPFFKGIPIVSRY